MVRRLSSTYSGPLYQVRKGGATQDIQAVNGFGDGASQDSYCGATDTCTVSILYDQSGNGNDLKVAPAGCYTGGDGKAAQPDHESDAKKRPLTISGHHVYALYMIPQDGYRNNTAHNTPLGNTAQGIYEIADGTHYGFACCWDFGNVAPDNCNGSTMDTLFFGTAYWDKGAGDGPWFMGDFEAGVWSMGTSPKMGAGAKPETNLNLPSSTMEFAFGILKTTAGQYTIRVGDATTGSLTTAYDGPSPKPWDNKGAIVLGVGGDNSNWSEGTFFEGVVTNGRPSDDTDALVLQNVQAAGYGK